MKITKQSHAHSGYSSTYDIETLKSFNPELQLEDNESAIKNRLKNLMTKLEGFKLKKTLVLEFIKIKSDNETKYSSLHLSSMVENIINESEINDLFKSIYSTVLSNIQKSLENHLK